MKKQLKNLCKGKLKYQACFEWCKDQEMTCEETYQYIREVKAVTAYNTFPTKATVVKEYLRYLATGKTNLKSSVHIHRYSELKRNAQSLQRTKYEVYSAIRQLGPLIRSELKVWCPGGSEKRIVAINQLLEEGFISEIKGEGFVITKK